VEASNPVTGTLKAVLALVTDLDERDRVAATQLGERHSDGTLEGAAGDFGSLMRIIARRSAFSDVRAVIEGVIKDLESGK